MWKLIRNRLAEIAQTVPGIEAIYGSAVASVSGYPALIVTPSESSSDTSTLASDKMTLTFELQVIHPIADFDPVAVDETLLDVVDPLTEALLPLDVMDGVADWVEPLGVTFGWQDRPNGNHRVATLKVRCVKHVNRQ